jgi:glycosyltransferase involved in cell wall biosynthesis
MSDTRYFLDVSPLRDYAWTGIPTVTARIARYLLNTRPEATVFYYGPEVVLPQFVAMAIDSAPGGYLRAFIEAGTAIAGSLDNALRGDFTSVGIFPNIKPVHRVFDFELVVMHDLSAILLPEMHTPEAAIEHSEAHVRDVATSDLVCCVSEATRQDVLQYLRVPPERVFVSHLGCDVAEETDEFALTSPVSPYVVVLGTIEPRKNLGLVADFIRCRPQICDELAFLFVGRRGWGAQFEDLFADIMRLPQCRERVLFTDYVTEGVKRRLLRHARFAIYPSLFEGFGLPVVECMAQGCLIITSRSSSLVELALDEDFYFDPLSLADFSRAFGLMHSMTMQEERRRQLSHDVTRRASAFSWDAFVERIIEKISERVGSLSATKISMPAQNLRQRRRVVA